MENTLTQHFPKGKILSTSSKECAGLIVVQKGQLRTHLLSEDGRDITLYRLFKGEVCILSASCMMEAITFDVFIEAEEDTEVFLIPSACFQGLSQNNIHLQNFGYRITQTRFSDVMWAMQQILFMSMDKRLAHFLLEEAKQSKQLSFKLTHEQIARYIGSAREVVSRMLKHFEQEGWVKLTRGSIHILQKEKLEQLCKN